MSCTVSVTDDEVLQVMSRLNLDAEELPIFRLVRHYLTYKVPLCCIAFHIFHVQPAHLWLPDLKKAERLIRKRNSPLGYLAFAFTSYLFWTDDNGAEELNYVPCPACALNKNFIYDFPDACPYCADEALDNTRCECGE